MSVYITFRETHGPLIVIDTFHTSVVETFRPFEFNVDIGNSPLNIQYLFVS